MAKFLVNSIFTIPNKSPVFISGTIVSGEINMGDHLETNEATGTISAIEFMDAKNGTFICLGIECDTKNDQNIWINKGIKQGDTLATNKNT